MARQTLAITTCRVSTPEQEENNSLDRQRSAVIRAAEELGAAIPEDGQWSGSVSSKAGTNTKRKDLKEMLEYCKRHPLVKYLIVHEVDRFMRSVDELFYFEVRFREEVGVRIIYASQPELNTNDYKAKLFKALEAFKGEGSNVERQMKSISGQTQALKDGRYTFAPKPGYRRGYEPGIQEIDRAHGVPLGTILKRIAAMRITPSQGLIEYNKIRVAIGKAPIKMDKFRKFVTDPFYAGIVEINKQVKVRNENGLHEPLISKAEHHHLVKIMDSKKKNQSGPRKGGNPKYPLNNLVTHDPCEHKKYGRLVGVDIHNGKNKDKIYEKYRCRECKSSLSRQELHAKIEQHFKSNLISKEGLADLTEALDTVWKQREGETEQAANRIKHKISSLRQGIANSVEAATDPSNIEIKSEILASIAKKKQEITDLENELNKVTTEAASHKDEFLKFAFDFVSDMGSRFLEISQENRSRCKQIVFPAGFRLGENKSVYTPEISPLYRLAINKKDLPSTEKSFLVRVQRL